MQSQDSSGRKHFLEKIQFISQKRTTIVKQVLLYCTLSLRKLIQLQKGLKKLRKIEIQL